MVKRLVAILILAMMLVPAAADANHETIPKPGAVPGAIPTLITRYDLKGLHPQVRYRPRQFVAGFTQIADVSWGSWTVQNAGAYSGWDVLPLPNEGSTRTSTVYPLATYTLSRPARVALVWRTETAPADWVAADGWTPAGNVVAFNAARNWTRTYPTYTKTLPTGTFTVGGNFDAGDSTTTGAKNLPWLLFAEADGTPSLPPVVPEGREVPVANQTCSDWVHDLHQDIGPDGTLYRTWHPAIDPIYWCYFRHEHGSDPRHAFPAGDFTPFYGYVTSGMTIPGTSIPMTENHWGHKTHVFQNMDGYWMLATQHVGTTGLARANTCLQRFHLVDLVVRNAERTETLAHVQVMGDYGRSLVNTNATPYTPTACPNGNAATGLTTTVPARKVPLSTTGQITYEPWQFNQTAYAAMGFTGTLTINTLNPLDICGSLVCDTPVGYTDRSGAERILQPTVPLRFRDLGLGVDGHFCTDGMGMVQDCALPNSIEQYIKPGLDLTFRGTGSLTQTHFETRPWGDVLAISAGETVKIDHEGSIQETHGPN